MTARTSRSVLAPSDCHLAKAIDLVGDRWTLLILRSALFGVRRFDDFQAELGIPRTVLSGRLKALVDRGLMRRESYKQEGKRARPEYVLSDSGAALRPVLIALMQWGDDWLGDGATPPMAFTHARTRQPVHAAFIDRNGEVASPEEIRISLRR